MQTIDVERVTVLRRTGLFWKQIAAQLGVSRRTLERWRDSPGNTFIDPLHTLAGDEQLDAIMRQYSSENWRNGARMAVGHLLGLGYHVPRWRVRESLQRVDPVGCENRRMKKIERRAYESAGPMHVWHIDGHHKMIKYNMVTMGCVDGYSKACIYMRTVNNNRADTALDIFKGAVNTFGIPSRVRGDRGGENVRIAEFIIQHRGLNRASYIAGSSKFNTRIERMWRELHQRCMMPYKKLFQELEQDGLDTENQVHMFSLHYMFLQRMNVSVDNFCMAWNNHKVTGEEATPLGILELRADLFPDPPLFNDHGDDDAGVDDDEEEGVHVEPIECPLNNAGLLELQHRRPPLSLQDAFDTLADKYMQALAVVTDIMYRE